MLDRFASLQDAPAKRGDKATDGFDLRFEFVKMQRQTGFALDVLDRGKAIDLPGRSAAADDLRPRLVVLVLDSPTMPSTRSSRQTMPPVPPYSSTTMAIWMRLACIWIRRSGSRIDSGTNMSREPATRSDARTAAPRSSPAHAFGDNVLDVNEAQSVHQAIRGRPACANGASVAKTLSTSPMVAVDFDSGDIDARGHHVADARCLEFLEAQADGAGVAAGGLASVRSQARARRRSDAPGVREASLAAEALHR
jgi:hypothetical protein